MASAVRLRMTKISASAPASVMALAESYSQLVPGKTGIRTLGRATLTAGALQLSALKETFSMGVLTSGMLQGNTSSSLSS